MKKTKRPHTDTTVPYIPADPKDIMAALLKTPPPQAGDNSTRKTKGPSSKKAKRRK